MHILTYKHEMHRMDMRKLDEVAPHVSPQVQRVLENVRFLRNCLDLHLDDQQGFMASGVQLYSTYDITIRENIMVSKSKRRQNAGPSNKLNHNASRTALYQTRSDSRKTTPLAL